MGDSAIAIAGLKNTDDEEDKKQRKIKSSFNR